MVSRSIGGFSLTALILSIVLAAAGSVQPARAASMPDLIPQEQVIKFYLDPALLSDMNFARAVLPKYVADMNFILAKNTRLRLIFDPDTGIIPTTTKPQSDSASPPLPTEGFEIWTHAVQTTYSISYGGYMGIDTSGAGVLAGFRWTRLYDPDNLDATQVRDYTTQIDHMLHELGHVYSAGIGEYYNLAGITDTTGAEPLLSVNVSDADDAYWSDKPDFRVDPMLRFTQKATRAEYLEAVQYSALTAAMLNGPYRNGVPSFTEFTVQVVDKRGAYVPYANIKVWNVRALSPNTSQLLYELQTDAQGRVTLPWGGTGNQHNAVNMLRLIKVYGPDGAPLAQPRYISIFDADIAKFVQQAASYVVTLTGSDHAPVDISLSGTMIDENEFPGTTIGQITGVDPDEGDTLSFGFCGGPDDASFEIADGNLQTLTSFNYEETGTLSICLEADDGFGGTLQKPFTIQVNDVLDANQLKAFRSSGIRDGWVRESAAGSGTGYRLNSTSGVAVVGRDAAGRQYRSVLSFNTSGLPDTAVVTGVTLKVKRRGGTELDPFMLFERLTADLSKPYFGSVSGLQRTDFQSTVGILDAAVFNSQLVDGWYVATLSQDALAYINLQGNTQFRLQFAGSSGFESVEASTMNFYSGNAALGNKPLLVVEYYVP